MYKDLYDTTFERVLFLRTSMKEIGQSHFMFRNAELFSKILFNGSNLNQVICFFFKKFLSEVEKPERLWEKKKNGEDKSAKESKCWTVHCWVEK